LLLCCLKKESVLLRKHPCKIYVFPVQSHPDILNFSMPHGQGEKTGEIFGAGYIFLLKLCSCLTYKIQKNHLLKGDDRQWMKKAIFFPKLTIM